MKRSARAIVILACIELLAIGIFVNGIGVFTKVMLFVAYCFLMLFLYIREKRYSVFTSKIVNILYSVVFLYFPASIWYFAFFDRESSLYYAIDIFFGLCFIGFSIADMIENP